MRKAKIFNGVNKKVASAKAHDLEKAKERLPDPEEALPEYLHPKLSSIISYKRRFVKKDANKWFLKVNVSAEEQFNLWREHNPEVELDFEKCVRATSSGITIFYEEGD